MRNLFQKKDVAQLLAQHQKRKNNPSMGAFDLTLLGIGAVIGTGVMVLTGITAAQNAGPAVIFSFILAAVVCSLAALCYAEISSALPVYGSAYIYSYTTMGEIVGHLMGWTLLSVYMLTSSAVASGWSSYFNNLLAGFGLSIPKQLLTTPEHGGVMNLPAIAITFIMTWILSKGTKESKKFNNAMVIVKILIVALFIIAGSFYVKPENWHPFMPFGTEGVITGAAAVFFAYLGFDAISASAEDVKNPQRNLPIGIIGSLLICTLIYILVCLVMTGMVPYSQLNVPEAMSYVLQVVQQNTVAEIISVGAVIGLMAVIFANTFAATRISFAMSRDGLLPKVFSITGKRSGAPVWNTWITGLITALVAGFVDLKNLSNLANMGALLTFLMVSLSVLILRKTHKDLPRGFKVPFVPVIPILSIGFCLFLIANLPAETWLYFSVWLLAGAAVYFGYSYKHSALKR
ncbi:amino acid permease [Bacillus sonorensis]|uniref:Amino acid transporter n=2 Tax=Bacillus sonorensis TaxID=119858 RepID=M5NZS3_9BACI|nr:MULTISPECIES: amino acid permease [Bacillus]TWK73951.1 putative amino acid permease YhdG [Bacillus paralicheniformis]ASB91248.1 putative amino acid permease YfnA [Bacillus sonorensis]EME72709.1 amino acid transporter [Bacillus sonorensis L12]MBG9917399.1 amino acid permease [Bacillus sonorensis]MCY7857146.1 amino acid permease [Bacillus sonorensis]